MNTLKMPCPFGICSSGVAKQYQVLLILTRYSFVSNMMHNSKLSVQSTVQPQPSKSRATLGTLRHAKSHVQCLSLAYLSYLPGQKLIHRQGLQSWP